MARDAYAIPQKRTVIFWSRKAGNTSLAQWLIQVLGLREGQGGADAKPRRFLEDACKGIRVDTATALDRIRKDGYEDFILARDPFQRAVSAYVEKFVYYGHRAMDSLDRLQPYARHAFLDAMRMKGDRTVDGEGPYRGWSFTEFLEYIAAKVRDRSQKREPDLNGHWNTQAPLSFDGSFAYKNIIRLERIADEIQPLAQKLGSTVPFPHSRKNTVPARLENDADLSGATSVELIEAGIVPGAGALLNPKTRSLIREAYAIDFRMLGYDPEGSGERSNPQPKDNIVTIENSGRIDPEKAPKKKKSKNAEPASVETFAATLNAMASFLSKLSDSSVFREHNLALTEWALLNALARRPFPANKIDKRIGIERKQARQLAEKLKSIGCVTVEGDGGMLVPTEEGKRRIGLINEHLNPLLARLDGKKGTVRKTAKNLRTLSRQMRKSEPRPEGSERKLKKKNKRSRE